MRAFSGRLVRNWDHALSDVQTSQMAQLRALLRHAQSAEFGHQHGFGLIKSYDDYRNAVPIGDYDSFSPAIERMRRGERGILVPEFVRYFGNSSGSSSQGKPKYLPITDRQIRYQQANGADAVARYVNHFGVNDFPNRFSLGLFPPITMKKEGPVLVTSNPALMVTKLPLLSRPCFLPENSVLRIQDYTAKLEVMAERYLDYDIGTVSGTTCWYSVLFDKVLAAARARGREVDTISEIWPNLKLLCGGGVAAAPYLPVINERVGHDITLVDTYNATEGGIYAATDHTGHPGMRMIPHRGVFFEFYPLEQEGRSDPERVPLWEVATDQDYVILVTTSSGLYSYKLGDIVRFTSTDPLRIEFSGRLSGCLSTTQELTTHREIQSAFEAAAKATGSASVDFSVGADVGVNGTSKSQYLIFSEFVAGQEPATAEAFAQAFDRALGQLNRVYEEHREGDLGILAPRLYSLPPGGAEAFMKTTGRISVQAKFPRIVQDSDRNVLRSLAKDGKK